MITNRRLYLGLPLAAVAIAVVILGALQWRSRSVVIEAGFWFDDVTFELPPLDVQQLGGALTEDEKTMLTDLAWDELRMAYGDLRLQLTDNRHAFYRVRVIQGFLTTSKMSRGAAGETHVMGPFGGWSDVSFVTIARGACAFAPAGATRKDIVEGIGRGIGRTSVHEIGHQLLGAQGLHSRDDRSYEYGSPDRIGQYYGPIHWDIAWEPLQKRLGQ